MENVAGGVCSKLCVRKCSSSRVDRVLHQASIRHTCKRYHCEVYGEDSCVLHLILGTLNSNIFALFVKWYWWTLALFGNRQYHGERRAGFHV